MHKLNLVPLLVAPMLLEPMSAFAKHKDNVNQNTPNVVFILADDIGYGDVGCYGAKRIKTPNIDKLAAEGVMFTNAYAPASTSSPTRYALLTGEYAFRKNVGIMPGDAPMSIDVNRNTLPKQMKAAGYKTAIVGKWHLGLGTKENPIDFNKKTSCGMNAVGFDYSYIFPATNDRVPTVFMENDLVVGLDKNDPIEVNYKHKIGNDPTGKENPELLKMRHFHGHDGTIINGIGRMGWMSGGNKARWTDETMGEVFLSKAENFITNNAGSPFFLYYATHNAHEPRVPNPKFKGKSEAGIYGDVIEEYDYYVGQIVETLRKEGILDNTIIVVTSDNGPMVKEGYVDGGLESIGDHKPTGALRGTKYTLYEGGTRMPFVVRWGDKIKKPFVQNQPFCFIDMLATLSDITKTAPVADSLNDSQSAAKLFLNKKAKAYKEFIVTQNNGGNIALRKGNMKYIHALNKNIKSELYDLKNDISESKNLISLPEYQNLIHDFENEYNRLKK